MSKTDLQAVREEIWDLGRMGADPRGLTWGHSRVFPVWVLVQAARGKYLVSGHIPKVGIYEIGENVSGCGYRSLYVGATCNGVERRILQHIRTPTTIGRLIREKKRAGYRFIVTMMPCAPYDVYNFEKLAIRESMPLLNQREG